MFSPEFSIQTSFYGSCFHHFAQIYIPVIFSILPSVYPSILKTSPVVQWLRLCTSTAAAWIWSLVGERRSYKPNSATSKKSIPQTIPYLTITLRFIIYLGIPLLTFSLILTMLKRIPCHPYLYTRSTISMG